MTDILDVLDQYSSSLHMAAADEIRRLRADLAKTTDLLALCRDALSLVDGWREAIAELEDYCGEPTRLKNMIAALDQIDIWKHKARSMITESS